jgi:hypothetical protein
MDTGEDSKLGGKKLLLFIPVVVAVGAVGVYVWAFNHLPFTEDPSAWGTFGDFFGGLLNPVVSCLTLFVAIQVWLLQGKELEETKKALRDQADTAKQQLSEQRFFDLLRVYQSTVDGLYLEQGAHYSGRQVLVQWFKGSASSYLQQFPTAQSLDPGRSKYPNGAEPKQELRDAWQGSKRAVLDHYFRVVFLLLEEAETILAEQRHLYINFFVAQLSQTEIFLLALYLWGDTEGMKDWSIAGEYGLLEHLPSGDFRTLLEQELPASVFGPKFAAGQTVQDAPSANPISKLEVS